MARVRTVLHQGTPNTVFKLYFRVYKIFYFVLIARNDFRMEIQIRLKEILRGGNIFLIKQTRIFWKIEYENLSWNHYKRIDLVKTRVRRTDLVRLHPTSASVRFQKLFSVRRPNPSLRWTKGVCPPSVPVRLNAQFERSISNVSYQFEEVIFLILTSVWLKLSSLFW